MFHGWWIVATVFMAQLFMVGFFSYGYPLLVVRGRDGVRLRHGSDQLRDDRADDAGARSCRSSSGPLVDRWSVRGLMLIGVGSAVERAPGVGVGAERDGVRDRDVDPDRRRQQRCSGRSSARPSSPAGSRASRGRALGIAAIGTSIGGILMPPLLGLRLRVDRMARQSARDGAALVVCRAPAARLRASAIIRAISACEPEGSQAGSHRGFERAGPRDLECRDPAAARRSGP